jgi:DNA-binding response OmpR family regulator
MKPAPPSQTATPPHRATNRPIESIPRREAPARPSAESPRTFPRLLLADDDATVRASLTDLLTMEGYVVIPARDGQHALELAASTEFDLVLLDLNMPVKNGWDTFEHLTSKHPLLPVVIITARPNQWFTAIGAGVGALLEKPMDIPTLLRTIRRLLAEPTKTRLARIAGQATDFHYSAAHPR